jgi:hypothetical protein
MTLSVSFVSKNMTCVTFCIIKVGANVGTVGPDVGVDVGTVGAEVGDAEVGAKDGDGEVGIEVGLDVVGLVILDDRQLSQSVQSVSLAQCPVATSQRRSFAQAQLSSGTPCVWSLTL